VTPFASASRGLAALIATVVTFTGPWMNRASATPDFGADRDAWNGVGYLIDTALEARVDLAVVERLDLATASPGDLVVMVAPDTFGDPTELVRFVASGGFLIAAFEGESFAPLARAFGVTLLSRDDEPALGVVETPRTATHAAGERSPEAFLFFNVDVLKTNHPDAFAFAEVPGLRPVLSFPDGKHLVVEARIGAGAALLIADGSVLLNQMLRRHYGNKQFAANAFRYFCQREPCGGVLVTSEGSVEGRFDEDLARLGPLQRDIRRFIDRVDEAIPTVLPGLGADAWPLGLLGLILATAPTWRRVARRRRGVTAQVPGPPHALLPSPPLEQALALAARRGAADFGALALGVIEHALAEARRARLSPGSGGPIVAGAMARLTADAERLRTRHSPGVSSEQFVRIQGDAEAILDYLRSARRPGRPPSRQEPTS
jgi:hypothetical protein